MNDFDENKNFVLVYTDGSKSDTYVSPSAVFPVDTFNVHRCALLLVPQFFCILHFKVNRHEHTSIFTAEAVALKLAVQPIQHEAIRKSDI